MIRKNLVGMLPFYLLAAIICIGAAQIGSHSVTTAVQTSAVEWKYTIVVDAGHGGIDGGATSCSGKLESGLNLQIAKRLDDLLHLLGYRTVMIRTTDTSIYTEGKTIAAQKVSDLKERVRIVNESPNAILVSIHQNTFSDSKYRGAQVFYAPTEGSRELAELLQPILWQERSCKEGKSVFLLQNIHCPGILVECGFLSNPEEDQLLQQPGYQQKISSVIACKLAEFINKNG